MAFITKADIVNGATILADFWTRIVRALDGTDTTDIRIKGELQLDPGKLKINSVAVTASAADLNGLAGRTAGIVVASKPVIAGANRDVDYLRAESLSVGQLLMDVPINPIGSALYLHANFK